MFNVLLVLIWVAVHVVEKTAMFCRMFQRKKPFLWKSHDPPLCHQSSWLFTESRPHTFCDVLNWTVDQRKEVDQGLLTFLIAVSICAGRKEAVIVCFEELQDSGRCLWNVSDVACCRYVCGRTVMWTETSYRPLSSKTRASRCWCLWDWFLGFLPYYVYLFDTRQTFIEQSAVFNQFLPWFWNSFACCRCLV